MSLSLPDHSHASSLFILGEDLFLLLCAWLPLKSISNLDIAVSNAEDRLFWSMWLGMIDVDVINEHKHRCHASIRWLIRKGIRTSSLQVLPCAVQMNDATFSGFGFPTKNSGHEIMKEKCNYFGGLSIKDCVRIDLSGCDITDANVVDLARGCPHLHTIFLGRCLDLTDISLIQLARCCPQLHTTNLSHIRNISDIGVSALVQMCSGLQVINLLGNKHITIVSISLLASCCPSLNTIQLDFGNWGKQMTDASIEDLVKNCRALRSVTLYAWTERIVSAFALACPQMRSLALGYCSGLSDNFISELGQKFPHLLIFYNDENNDGYDEEYEGEDWDDGDSSYEGGLSFGNNIITKHDDFYDLI